MKQRVARLARATSPAVFALCAMAGCVSQQLATTPGTRPDDFSLSISRATQGEIGVNAPAWYVLDADGSLRGALGVPGAYASLPPLLRHLNAAQTQRVWDEVQASGLAAGVYSLPQESPGVLASQGSAVVYLAAGGARRTVVVSPGDPAMAGVDQLTNTLRELGWVRE
jgi:hypothetical protein